MARALLLVLSGLTSGCTTTQLSYTTTNVATSVEDIEKAQVIANLGRFVANPFSFPSQVTLTAGTAQVLNSISPSVTFPLSNMFAQAAAATITRTTTTAGGGATIGGSISWQQNYNIAPINDPFTVRNLAALYRAVVFCKQRIVGYDEQDSKTGSENISDSGYYLRDYQVPRVYSRGDLLVPDPYYLARPNCVRCAVKPDVLPSSINELLHPSTENNSIFKSCWLLHAPKSSPPNFGPPDNPSAFVKLGTWDNTILYTTNADRGKFAEFIILTLPVASEPTRFPSVSTTSPSVTPKIPKKGTSKELGNHEMQLPLQDFDELKIGPGRSEGSAPSQTTIIPGIQPQQQP